MGEYIRKIPFFNDYEKKKDLLKFPHLKESDNDGKKNLNNNINQDVYYIKKRENMKDILTYLPNLNNRTQRDIFNERKNKLKEDISESYYSYEEKFPFLINTCVKKIEETRNMGDVLNNKYEPDETRKTRIYEGIKTKTMLLEARKKLYMDELKSINREAKNYMYNIIKKNNKNNMDIIKDKNKILTLKNYGLGLAPSNFVFSYPHIQAKGRGGFATDIMKSIILKNKNEKINKKINVNDINDLYKDKNNKEREEKVFLMINRFKYINYTRKSYSVDNYLKEKPHIILRYKGFQRKA
ncbi:conserved Plasmodium protein, unknown function [Plasmodium gallinaceum]|uniref:Uncharacterized protein n=1 Tax=Plasmodium gallinaceum TaxID=5849 RepID=A0A1J1GV88_PLAGA|nr:conserved Plasmodium protein, unknown function [Plasmodium gallinaceum]CRG96465.1 conserved Plasmodium protein, unknown function [Plasmodium gallinaceum]